ncbi:hypothetical protein E4U57_000784 [Claviceps arundinis]|uniref:Uncharacterized protein n=1 Tax=Claviceps arundinis TaxID=1623583 RepID=A0ABQ7PC65_9HYPO|nr:hypothetical protein E4U57_000784 [Claviceps arundinis]
MNGNENVFDTVYIPRFQATLNKPGGADLQPPLAHQKLLPPQLLHKPPGPCRHPEHRLGRGPNPLQQHLAGITLVKSTTGSYSKTESAIVNKAVSDSANELLEARRTSLQLTTHDTPGGDEEKHSSDPPKSAAFRPCDEPEQYPNEAPDKESPTNEEEPSNNEDSADVEESDGPDSHRRSKGESQRDISRGFCDCSISGMFLDAARPEASNEYQPTRTLVNHFFADWANYFQLVERLVVYHEEIFYTRSIG